METQKIGIIGTGGRGEHARRAHQPENGWIVFSGEEGAQFHIYLSQP